MFVEFIDYDIESVLHNHGDSYHGGSISPWMESIQLDKPRIGFVREPKPEPAAVATIDLREEGITDPSWMLF